MSEPTDDPLPGEPPASPEPEADASWLLTEPAPEEPGPAPSSGQADAGEYDIAGPEPESRPVILPAEDEPAPEPPTTEPPAPASDLGYDVASAEPTPLTVPPPQAVEEPKPAPMAPEPAPRASVRKRAEPRDEPSTVRPVWSRSGEWGLDLLKVIGAFLGTLLLAFLGTAFGSFGLGFLLFLAGLAATVVLAYPMLITLERPVRLTPEQTVNYYFEAASHARPHLRRMWLLLSDRGRSDFGGRERFEAYWRQKLLEHREGLPTGPLAAFNPVRFEVNSFDGPGGKDEDFIPASFDLVLERPSTDGATLRTRVPRRVTLSRGPDRMWYLDDGRVEG